MGWTYAYKCSLPDDCFAYVQGDVRKLPVFNHRGKLDLPHLRNALARLPLTDLPNEAVRARIKAKLKDLLARSKSNEELGFGKVTNADWQPVCATPQQVRKMQARGNLALRNPALRNPALRNPALRSPALRSPALRNNPAHGTERSVRDIFDQQRRLFACYYPWCADARLVIHPLQHSPDSPGRFRDVAWAQPHDLTIHLVQRACAFEPGRIWGVLAHEFGHLADPRASEAQADVLAGAVLCTPILYDEDDLQNVERGKWVRPAHLHA